MYVANLAKNNEENDLHHAIGSAGINESGILSSCIYIDVNKFKQNPYLKLISTIHKLFDDNDIEDHNNKTKPIISYNLHGYNVKRLYDQSRNGANLIGIISYHNLSRG